MIRSLPWRFQTDDTGGFDELVVGKGLHVEMMDTRVCWLAINRPDGERWSFTIVFNADGSVKHVNPQDEPPESVGG